MTKKVLFVAIAMMFLTGAAMAGEITGAATVNVDDAALAPVVYAQEMVNATLSTRVPGNAVNLEIVTGDRGATAGNWALAGGYKAFFTLPSGTTWASTSASMTLACNEAGAINNVIRINGGYGSNSLEMQFSVHANVPFSAFDDFVLTSTDGGGLRVSNGTLATSGNAITVAAEIRDSGNLLMTGASLSFMKSYYGFEVVTNATASTGTVVTIDCATGRKQFNIGGVLTTVNGAGTTITFDQVANAKQGDGATDFALVAADMWTFQVTGDMNGVAQAWLDLNGNGVVDTTSNPSEIGVVTGTTPSQTASWTNLQIATCTADAAKNLRFIGDGTTILEDRALSAKCTLNMSDSSFNDNSNVNINRSATAIGGGAVAPGSAQSLLQAWGHNCWEGTTPYINKSTDYSTFIKFLNRSTLNGSIIVDVYPDGGTAVLNKTLTQTVPAGSTAIVWATDIATAAGVTANSFGLRIIVTSPSTGIFATVVQKSLNGQRVMPIYHNQVRGY